MTTARRPRSRLRLLRLLSVMAFAIALAGGAASAAPTAADHAASCKCGVKCRRDACCCGPRTPKASPRPETPAESEPVAEALDAEEPGPCLGASPGGDDAAATTKTASIGGDESACVGARLLLANRRGARIPPPSSDRADTIDPARIDRPPKPAPSA